MNGNVRLETRHEKRCAVMRSPNICRRIRCGSTNSTLGGRALAAAGVGHPHRYIMPHDRSDKCFPGPKATADGGRPANAARLSAAVRMDIEAPGPTVVIGVIARRQ